MSETIIKNCPEHGETEFSVSQSRPQGRCKKCNCNAVVKRRRKIKKLAVQYKGSKCSKCGITGPSCIYDFHHTDPSKKNFGIAHRGHCRSWSEVKQELDQCVLLCANCHRIEEHSLSKDFLQE
jgi:hypothetical protein